MSMFLHTMLRVFDLDKSISFYKTLGLHEVRRKDVPEGKYTLVYMAYQGNDKGGAELELTYNWGSETPYNVGTGFGHLAFGVDDVTQLVEKIRQSGGKITREPGPVKFGKTFIAFVEDPDGYKIELIQNN
ncbi:MULTISPECIES: lactoylglutathione lyase [Commensalibacter]|uniref:lactoylglutathione lyase n=1 Tax=Commensalibacter TaxID=1079922 RepID=UPI0018DC7FB9|nr:MULTISPECIES: lactoylglutathione lyase [Commensalibacter]MBH9972954.1 lactoylglutathione lyase [Commensalibacter melissae]MBI0016515.1 lactoylglutathione lyase [Commensalibacter sp. B14384M2]MBI0018262.1 lactoylglutathione lyase [Commensalibacter sp. W8133]MBI0049700.1 lactoylglutathione lyase [Commensalibacter sp. B14384M3]MBI0179747.1 lactoylglutathione lyase [Commensalibacter sp. W8163]